MARLAPLLLGAAVTAVTAVTAVAAGAQQPPPTPRVVTVTATAVGLEAPAEVPAGPVTIVLVNRARSVVEAQLLAVQGGHTPDEAVRLLQGGAPRPDWLAAAGGVGPLAPGLGAAVTQTLPPGEYLVLSMLPDSTRLPQYRRGYLTVLQATGRADVAARVDGAVAELAVGTSFRFQRVQTLGGRRVILSGRQRSAPIAPGDHAIEITYGPLATHQVALVRVDSALILRRYADWLAGGQRGPAPGRAWGGVALTPPGRQLWLRARLESGTYWLICTAAHGGRRGFEIGEYAQFVVR